MSQADKIYASPHLAIKEFVFDDRVASVFSDMISRSVPGYATTISTIGEIANQHAEADSQLYDLGCSLGAATLAMRHGVEGRNCNIIAIDNSAAMIERCQTHIDNDNGTTPVTLIEGDILAANIENASLVVLNFTLQFISIEKRLPLLKKIVAGMRPGAKLVLSEKVIFPDETLNQLNIDLHHRFKKAHGYSDLEVSQKRSALDNMLIPETVEQHKKRLLEAGFSRADVWYQCFNFVSFVAVK